MRNVPITLTCSSSMDACASASTGDSGSGINSGISPDKEKSFCGRSRARIVCVRAWLSGTAAKLDKSTSSIWADCGRSRGRIVCVRAWLSGTAARLDKSMSSIWTDSAGTGGASAGGATDGGAARSKSNSAARFRRHFPCSTGSGRLAGRRLFGDVEAEVRQQIDFHRRRRCRLGNGGRRRRQLDHRQLGTEIFNSRGRFGRHARLPAMGFDRRHRFRGRRAAREHQGQQLLLGAHRVGGDAEMAGLPGAVRALGDVPRPRGRSRASARRRQAFACRRCSGFFCSREPGVEHLPPSTSRPRRIRSGPPCASCP